MSFALLKSKQIHTLNYLVIDNEKRNVPTGWIDPKNRLLMAKKSILSSE
jgi:hypothetical protein